MDPGFWSGGVQLSENFDKQKKSKKKKGEYTKKTDGCSASFRSAEVFFKSTFQTIIYLHTSLFPVEGWVFCIIASLFLHKYTDDMVVVWGGGLGVLHQKFFGLNGVKSCNSRPEKYDIDTIGEVCLQFLSTPNFIHQQNEAIFKQNDYFQIHCAWNRATRGIWRKRK